MDISKTIRKILIDKDMTQGQLIAKLGLTSKQSASYFFNKNDYFITKDIERVADILGFEVKLQFIDRQTGKVIECD